MREQYAGAVEVLRFENVSLDLIVELLSLGLIPSPSTPYVCKKQYAYTMETRFICTVVGLIGSRILLLVNVCDVIRISTG